MAVGIIDFDDGGVLELELAIEFFATFEVDGEGFDAVIHEVVGFAVGE